MNVLRKRLLSAVMVLLCFISLPALSDSAPTASGLVAYVDAQQGNGYIYGAYGQSSTLNFRHGRAQLYPEFAELIFAWGDAWDGLPAFDCIGLYKGYILDTGAAVNFQSVNTTQAWRDWVSEWGVLDDNAILQPGMALFRVEGSRMRVQHIGVYVGDGMVVHARGTRWGVVKEALPNIFTHWARLNWIDYDNAADPAPAVSKVFLEAGETAMIESSDAKPVTVSPIPHESGKLRQSIGYFEDGAILQVLEVPDEISRLVEGIGSNGQPLKGYVRTTELREAP